ncbi:hypothetical protein BDW59DRAFT_165234 [Aspergillus cavernicola]|uniref:Uncharacterized protein n=1 Tax=Aspergillus cavernicola TaxID=176166 RepID=A0ABR4HUB5_9EURO
MEIFLALDKPNINAPHTLLKLGIDYRRFVLHPLHYMSMPPFNEAHNRDRAIEMIKYRIHKGSNPFLLCDDHTRILQ